MNIKTMTCHHVYNYGATLQAYALQTYLESQGHNVEIIDYRLPTHIKYELFSIYPEGRLYPFLKRHKFISYLYAPIRNREMFYTWGRKNNFDNFDRKFLNITPKRYRTIDELRADSPIADVYIAGSDQIWNPDYLNGTDEGYYLNFGNCETRRVSYAASFGVDALSMQQQEFVKQHLNEFDFISVRETSGLKIVNELGLNAELCVDPVFLLTKDEWITNLKLETTDNDYIMLYDFVHDDDKIKKFALQLKEKTGLKIIAVNDYSRTPYADRQINNAGPKEFLEFILNSKYVICNSFHATAFSIIFHKCMATFPLKKQKNASRMKNILQTAGLINHYLPNINDFMNLNIDWGKVDLNVANNISSSKKYLNNALYARK